jgi:hypothetical protein
MAKKTIRPYDVGHSKPPRETRFQPGVSGNPKGRPKGAISLTTRLNRVLSEKIIVSEGGRKKSVTKIDAAVMHLIRLALSSDMRAMNLVVSLVSMAEQKAESEQPLERPLGRTETRMLKSLAKQLKTMGKDTGHE